MVPAVQNQLIGYLMRREASLKTPALTLRYIGGGGRFTSLSVVVLPFTQNINPYLKILDLSKHLVANAHMIFFLFRGGGHIEPCLVLLPVPVHGFVSVKL